MGRCVSVAFARQVGVLQTKDSAGTVRLLKNISAWLAWTLLLDCAIFCGWGSGMSCFEDLKATLLFELRRAYTLVM